MELEQDPMDVPDTEREESSETMEEDEVEEEGVDLKKMADDYAKYLIVNSKRDVRALS